MIVYLDVEGEVESETQRKVRFKIAFRTAELVYQDDLDTCHHEALAITNEDVLASQKTNPDEVTARVIIFDLNAKIAGKPINLAVTVSLLARCPPTKLARVEQLRLDTKQFSPITKEETKIDFHRRRDYMHDWSAKYQRQITWAACRAFEIVRSKYLVRG